LRSTTAASNRATLSGSPSSARTTSRCLHGSRGLRFASAVVVAAWLVLLIAGGFGLRLSPLLSNSFGVPGTTPTGQRRSWNGTLATARTASTSSSSPRAGGSLRRCARSCRRQSIEPHLVSFGARRTATGRRPPDPLRDGRLATRPRASEDKQRPPTPRASHPFRRSWVRDRPGSDSTRPRPGLQQRPSAR